MTKAKPQTVRPDPVLGDGAIAIFEPSATPSWKRSGSGQRTLTVNVHPDGHWLSFDTKEVALAPKGISRSTWFTADAAAARAIFDHLKDVFEPDLVEVDRALTVGAWVRAEDGRVGRVVDERQGWRSVQVRFSDGTQEGDRVWIEAATSLVVLAPRRETAAAAA